MTWNVCSARPRGAHFSDPQSEAGLVVSWVLAGSRLLAICGNDVQRWASILPVNLAVSVLDRRWGF